MDMASTVAKGVMFCASSSSRVSHFGMKPDRGGSPPSDSRVAMIKGASIGDVVHVVVKSWVVLVEEKISDSIMGVEIVMYIMRLRRARLLDFVTIVAIHPKWAIEENAMIFRSCVWFSPPSPPTITDKDPITVRVSIEVWFHVRRSRVIGANFCHVMIISPVLNDDPCITSGSQKWAGASPSFIARATVRSVWASGSSSCRMLHWPVIWAFIVLEKRIRADAVACVRKYFVEASVARGW